MHARVEKKDAKFLRVRWQGFGGLAMIRKEVFCDSAAGGL